MIRYLFRRWADPLLRRENEQLRAKVRQVERELKAQKNANRTLESVLSVKEARAGLDAQRAETWKQIAKRYGAELDAMKEKT